MGRCTLACCQQPFPPPHCQKLRVEIERGTSGSAGLVRHDCVRRAHCLRFRFPGVPVHRGTLVLQSSGHSCIALFAQCAACAARCLRMASFAQCADLHSAPLAQCAACAVHYLRSAPLAQCADSAARRLCCGTLAQCAACAVRPFEQVAVCAVRTLSRAPPVQCDHCAVRRLRSATPAQ